MPSNDGDLYICDRGIQQGPFDVAHVRVLQAQGKISPEVLYWREGMGEWKPVAGSLLPPAPPQRIQPVIQETSSKRIYMVARCHLRFWQFALACIAVCVTLLLILIYKNNPHAAVEWLPLWILGRVLVGVLIWLWARMRLALYGVGWGLAIVLFTVGLPFLLLIEIPYTAFAVRRFYRNEGITTGGLGICSNAIVRELRPEGRIW